MQAINCPRCGRLFNKIVSPVCQSCEKLEEEQFQELRHFLEENPLATITECSDATSVPTKRILRYIREGRLVVPEGMVEEIRCNQCGKQIDEGTFCDACAVKMAKELAASIGMPDPTHKPKKTGIDRRGVGFHTRNQGGKID